MRVKELMTAPAATVAPEDSLHIADGIMSMGVVRHLPVVSDGSVVGVLSEGDILRSPRLLSPVLGLAAEPRAALKTLRVQDAMTSTVVSIGPDASIQEAAATLLRHRISSLPVLEDGNLVGIVTTADLLRSMARSEPAAARARKGGGPPPFERSQPGRLAGPRSIPAGGS